MVSGSIDAGLRRVALVLLLAAAAVAVVACSSLSEPVDDDTAGSWEGDTGEGASGTDPDQGGTSTPPSYGGVGNAPSDGGSPPADDPESDPPEPDGDEVESQDVAAPALPDPFPPYEPHPEELYPNAKRLGSLVAQALTTYDRGDDAESIAAQLLDDPDAIADLAADTEELVIEDAASRGQVVYPQLGGVTEDAASIMVVVRQSLWRDGVESSVTRTLDVRLRLEDGVWVFDRLAQNGGPPMVRPERLSEAARAVLEHPAIWLPTSARWDIYEGIVDERLLELMVEIADDHEIAVVSLMRGHPLHVFGEDRVSEHIPGYAVDVYKVDGEIVAAQQQEGTAAHTLSRRLFDGGLARLGSPWAFDEYGGRSFSDVVHHDHLHISVGPLPDDDEADDDDADADGPAGAAEG